MKYSYNWLKELSKTKLSPEKLAELINARAFEFESMKKEGGETQLEFDILPNRGHDALSHIGIAREICAAEGRKMAFTMNKELPTASSSELKIEIKDKILCPRYIGAIVENIKVSSSPKWVQQRLLASGIKPINNIVDITNYVMLETGQPLHAFNSNRIESKFPISNFKFPNKSQNPNPKIQIVVRRARKNETIKLLDEKVYDLEENNLVIADSEKALALAGVMGGLDSSISSKTTSIILESANFNSTNIRKTRTRHNITTESSYRFERDIDPNLTEMGMARAIELIQKICGKNVKITAITDIYPKKIKSWKIKLNTAYVNNLLGEKIPVSKIKNILENLGIKLLGSQGPKLNLEIPTRRIDLKTQEDLIEEIGRIFGYENIKEQALVAEVKTPPQNIKRIFENDLRDILTGLGFSEVMNYSFYSKDDIEKCNLKVEKHIEVANPLSSDQKYLRWSLIPNLIKSVKLNLKNFSKFNIFEIGHKFHKIKGTFKEAAVLAGATIQSSAKEIPFFELKGNVEAMLSKTGYKNVTFRLIDMEYNFWHRSRVAKIIVNDKEVGRVGEVNPMVLRNYGIKQRVAVFGIRITDLLSMGLPEEEEFELINKYPSVKRDISMFVTEDINYFNIEKKIYSVGGSLVLGIELFDVFEKEGERSLALRIEIGSRGKTLTSEEIDNLMKKIILALEKDLRVRVRKQ